MGEETGHLMAEHTRPLAGGSSGWKIDLVPGEGLEDVSQGDGDYTMADYAVYGCIAVTLGVSKPEPSSIVAFVTRNRNCGGMVRGGAGRSALLIVGSSSDSSKSDSRRRRGGTLIMSPLRILPSRFGLSRIATD